MIREWLLYVLGTFVSLFPIVNPFSTAVGFLAITQRFSEHDKQHQARMACVYAAAILIVFMVAGALIMRFFGISLPAVQIAGGLIVARIGFGMLQPNPSAAGSDDTADEARGMSDVAFTPLAMPMMSGPGAIAVTIGMAANVQHWIDYTAIATGIILVALVSWLVLRGAKNVTHFLGATGLNAMSRIMGFLLVCIGVQFIGFAVITVLSHEKFLAAVVETLRNVTQK